MSDLNTTPTENPKVTLGGKTYTLKFRLYDIVQLWKNHKIDLATRSDLKGAEALERIPHMMSAAIAHEADLPAEDIAKLIDLADLPLYVEKVVEAQKKVSPEAAQAAARLQPEIQSAAPANGIPTPPTSPS